MKEDILEQIVEDYLHKKGYFTCHNVRYRDDEKGQTHSDIDVIGLHPRKRGREKVVVVNCKSWQQGYSAEEYLRYYINEQIPYKRSVVKNDTTQIQKGDLKSTPDKKKEEVKELLDEQWRKALLDKILEMSGSRRFTYITAVTFVKGPNVKEWHEKMNKYYSKQTGTSECSIHYQLLTLKEMLDFLYENTSTSIKGSELGRFVQVVKAAEWVPKESLKWTKDAPLTDEDVGYVLMRLHAQFKETVRYKTRKKYIDEMKSVLKNSNTSK